MNYLVYVNYKADGITWNEGIPIMNAHNQENAMERAILHIRSTVPRISGGVSIAHAEPLNCQGCGE